MTDESNPTLKIGLTMRVVETVGYSENRDALAMDWPRFLRTTIPEISWIPLPNIGKEIVDYANDWGLGGFIFTGGNDLGEVEVKDETDFALLDHCIENRLPAVGICRGLQLMQAHFGGKLQRCAADVHVANHHSVRFTDSIEIPELKNTEHRVNSFHNFGIRSEDLDSHIEPTAFTEDGWVEAALVKNAPFTAVMWHPERNTPVEKIDQKIVRHAFGLDIERTESI